MKYLVSAMFVMATVACGSSENAADEKSGAERVPEPAVAEKPPEPTKVEPKAVVAVGSQAEGLSYTLKSEADETYPVAGGTFAVELAGRGEWHVNDKYPIELTFKSDDGVTISKSKLSREDAKVFTEENARFEVAFGTDAPGKRDVIAELNFAMCSPKNCVPETQRVKATLNTVL